MGWSQRFAAAFPPRSNGIHGCTKQPKKYPKTCKWYSSGHVGTSTLSIWGYGSTLSLNMFEPKFEPQNPIAVLLFRNYHGAHWDSPRIQPHNISHIWSLQAPAAVRACTSEFQPHVPWSTVDINLSRTRRIFSKCRLPAKCNMNSTKKDSLHAFHRDSLWKNWKRACMGAVNSLKHSLSLR